MEWVWSDTHFFHENIIKYENRPFENAKEMNKVLLSNWRKKVKSKDILYHLGDVSLANKIETEKIIKSMPGYKILILGNHDRSHSEKWWREVGFDAVYKYPIIIEGFYMLSHEPLYVGPETPYANIHGHTHSESSVNKLKFNVSVENINYEPISLDVVKQEIKGIE